MDVKNLKMKYSELESNMEDITIYLKERLAEAQLNKNADDAVKIQEQIWTLKDFKAGHLQNINKKRLEEVHNMFSQILQIKEKTDTEKKLKALNKKRDQILKLIEREKKGEKLEQNQIDKIKSISKIEEEIENLKEN